MYSKFNFLTGLKVISNINRLDYFNVAVSFIWSNFLFYLMPILFGVYEC